MMKKVTLVGACPIQNISFMNHVNHHFLVACDGGYEVFLKANKEPDLFVGDFDTFDQNRIIHPKELVQLSTIKDDTDTFFAVKKCLALGYDTFYFYGCIGGKIDHSLANIQLLKYLRRHQANGYLIDVDHDQILFLMSANEQRRFLPCANKMFSIFAVSEIVTGLTLKNFKYELEDNSLSNDIPLGISNEFLTGKEAILSLKQGYLLIVAPLSSMTDF